MTSNVVDPILTWRFRALMGSRVMTDRERPLVEHLRGCEHCRWIAASIVLCPMGDHLYEGPEQYKETR